ncbi:hypothetical protein OH77DRAFT_1020621 [Trametes cingulata]|nr:hypothetical protein OH77DRAFT_1020621 [Trametes cingulata]
MTPLPPPLHPPCLRSASQAMHPRSRRPLSVVHYQNLAALDVPCAVPASSSQQAPLVALPRCASGPGTFRAVRNICSRSYTELHAPCKAGASLAVT